MKTRNAVAHSPAMEPRLKFKFVVLGALYGLILVRIFVSFAYHDEVGKSNVFNVYVLSWLIALLGGPILAWGLAKGRGRWLPPGDPALHLLLATALLLFSLSLESMGPAVGGGLLVAFLLTQGAASWAHGSHPSRGPLMSLEVTAFYLFLVWAFFQTSDWFLGPTRWKAVHFLLAAFLAWAIPTGLRAKADWKPGWADLLALTGLAFLVVDPRFPTDTYHANYYLGPLADLLAGKTLLVDINAQYGVLVFWFLAAIFKFLPLGYFSLSLLVTFLILVQYAVFYFITTRLFGRGLYALTTVAVLLLLNHFAQLGYASNFPSTGPLRFGFIYLLMGLVLLRNARPSWTMACRALETLAVALSFFWSLEVCVYTVPAYGGLILFESLETEGGGAFRWRPLTLRIGAVLVSVAALGAWIYYVTRLQSGQWPHWSYYLDYIFLYRNGFGMMPLPAKGVWWVMMGVYDLSLVAAVALRFQRDRRERESQNLNLVFLLALYGVFQFFYYLGRAHPNNLFHVSMPATLLSAYWLHFLAKRAPEAVPAPIRRGITWGAVGMIALCLPVIFPTAVRKLKEQAMSPAKAARLFRDGMEGEAKADRFAQEASDLMDRYSPGKRLVPYYFAEKGPGIGYYHGKVKVDPYNDIDQAVICRTALIRLIEFDAPLQPGDCVYFLMDYLARPNPRKGERLRFRAHGPLGSGDNLSPLDVRKEYFRALEIDRLERIARKHPIEFVEEKDGIVVGRLSP